MRISAVHVVNWEDGDSFQSSCQIDASTGAIVYRQNCEVDSGKVIDSEFLTVDGVVFQVKRVEGRIALADPKEAKQAILLLLQASSFSA
ncbi:hypothetical protein ACI2KR_27420 [Pseudomonas luteola]